MEMAKEEEVGVRVAAAYLSPLHSTTSGVLYWVWLHYGKWLVAISYGNGQLHSN